MDGEGTNKNLKGWCAKIPHRPSNGSRTKNPRGGKSISSQTKKKNKKKTGVVGGVKYSVVPLWGGGIRCGDDAVTRATTEGYKRNGV